MGAFSNYSSKKLLDHIFANGRAQTWSPPAALYLGLFTSGAGLANNTPGEQTEVSGGAYAREKLNGTTNYFRPADGFEAVLHADVDWAVATADWGTITHVAVLDAASGGNVVLWSPLTTSKLIETNDIMGVLATDLVASLSSVGMSTYSAKKALDHMLANGRAQTWSPSTSLWVALFTGSNGLASNLPGSQQEVAGGAYSRLRLDGADNFMTVAANFATTLYADLEWPLATSYWGNVTHAAIMDSEIGGNVISWGALTRPKLIETNDRCVIKSGNITVSLV